MEFSKKFVCEDREFSTFEKNVPSPLFRKSFVLEEKADRAELLICGLGFYDLFVNGRKITKGLLAPYISNSDHICYYDKYDIKEYLTKGENVIGVMLGDGYQVGKTHTWDFRYNPTNSAPLLALSAEVECNGETIAFEADSFVCKKGPVIFNDLRAGVHYDARLEEDGWNMPGFAEKDWHAPICDAYRPRGYAKLCEAEPIKVYRELKPISIKKGGRAEYNPPFSDEVTDGFKTFEKPSELDGGFIYDFGENNSGILRLKIKGERGQKVSMQCCEQLNGDKADYSNICFIPDGFSQRDIYYLKGGSEENFETVFTYHGFRYVYVTGITEEQATEDLLTYLVISSDLEKRGSFECSDDIANAIYKMGKRSDSSNFIYFPLDCPHREKNGWTGDASVSAEHMIMTMGTEKSWREWLNNVRASQKDSGELPGIVPTDNWGYIYGPVWDSVIFTLPYFAYKYRGETEIIKENASAMLRYLEYISKKRSDKGLVTYGLGDWLPVVREDGEQFTNYSRDFMVSTVLYDSCLKAKEMFDTADLPLHAAFAETLGNELYAAVRREYIDTKTCTVREATQTTQAVALFYGMFKKEEEQKAFGVLKDIIHKHGDSITSGHLGLRVIFHILSRFGEADLAYKMITRSEYPGYGYWASKGETTMLECFEEYDGYYAKSKNHHFMGDVVNWFISSPGGIKVQNCREVKVAPDFVSGMDWCHASHKLPGGNVEVYWERKNDKVELTVKTDGNIKCTVEPAADFELGDDGKYIING